MSDAVGMTIENQAREPKSALGLFTLPCGYLDADGKLYTEVSLREITGEEEDMLAAKKVPTSRKLNELLARCTERIGPITDKGQIATLVPELLVGDSVYLLLAIRRVSLGDEYPFEEKCPECEKRSLFTVDLSELEIYSMPDPARRVYDETLPSGRKVRFSAMNGRRQERLVEQGLDNRSQAILARLDLLDEKPPSMEAVKTLSMRDRNYLTDLFNDVEGGVDTTLQLTCPKCDADFERMMEVQAGFFFPSGGKRNSKRKRST